ncbi:uncharacterized protein LOC108163861 [Drosophila miranda]|uniref:uncharacterized protein LOC108163861 n=1 Tax=Drosophila miranda TaxID=7229 RepID=UPI0007E728B7|nr:uncharacterized protein LOC108163861 [Drosophila miranda]
MDSKTFVLLLLVACLCVACCVAAPQGCNGGLYARNGNIVIDLHNLNGLFDCVERQHQRSG